MIHHIFKTILMFIPLTTVILTWKKNQLYLAKISHFRRELKFGRGGGHYLLLKYTNFIRIAQMSKTEAIKIWIFFHCHCNLKKKKQTKVYSSISPIIYSLISEIKSCCLIILLYILLRIYGIYPLWDRFH